MLRKKNHRGEAGVEYIVVAAVAIAVVAIAIWGIAQNANAQGDNVASWIDGINVPTSP